MINRNLVPSVCLLMLLAIVSIGSAQEENTAYFKRVKIEDHLEAEVFSVKFYAAKEKHYFKIEIPKLTLTATATLDAKQTRTYQSGDGMKNECEVIHSDSGFKVKTQAGQLLWKVKFKDNGDIEVADNEAMNQAYRLDRKDNKKTKLMEGERVIAEVKHYPDTGKLKVKSATGKELYLAREPRKTAAIALLVCPRIAKREQAIIMTELITLEK